MLADLTPLGAGIEGQPSRRHFIFLDQEIILTLELVRPGVPIFNFVNLGNGSFLLQASNVRIISGIKLYRPNLFDIDTSTRNDPLRVSAIKVHPHSSFGLTLKGNIEAITEIDRVTIELGPDRFELQSISTQDFEALSAKISKLSLISPDIRDDFRVLEIKSLGSRKAIPR
jgi:hypothetical protein